MTDQPKASHVYKAIAEIAGEMSKEGISKSRKNAQQGYNFRGIDEVYNALAPMLPAHNLVILTRVKKRDVVERTSQKGAVLFYVTLEVDFDFVSALDGSKHTVTTFGEAMDSGDKATNKAMSAAYKYACIQAFCIPTEGDNDADATTHQVAPRSNDDGPQLTKEQQELVVFLKKARETIESINDVSEIDQWCADNIDSLVKISDEQKSWFDRILSKRKAALVANQVGYQPSVMAAG